MAITPLLRPLLTRRLTALDRYRSEGAELQRDVLSRLIQQGRRTLWGVEHGYDRALTYDDFARLTPVSDYDALKGLIDRMRRGEKDVLWPGRVRWYAKSSGTTSDKSKFIPVSAQALSDTHYRGGHDAVAWYLRNHPESRLMDGRALILGGSHAPNYNQGDSLVGDLSAILIENISPLVNLLRIPDKKTALMPSFEEKRRRIAELALHAPVTSLSGVPSWMMSLLTEVLEQSGRRDITEVWPTLEVFFHGGVAFTPYREQYLRMIPSPAMHYMETYNASEGFFGLQDDPADKAMSLMLDYGVFYEFRALGGTDVVPLWGVETGTNYAMIITTTSGLWRYEIGDTVRFTSTNPYKFVITGRTRSFINAFGEELIVDNAEKGLEKACRDCGAEVREYTAAPVFMDEKGRCRHQWVIEFAREPASIEAFAKSLDDALQRLNSDYEAKRARDITLQRLEVIAARKGLFDDWLKRKGKLGGQHKVPRLMNDRTIIDEVIRINEE